MSAEEIHVPAIGEEEMPPESVTEAKIDMVLSGLLVPSQGFAKGMAQQVRELRGQVERLSASVSVAEITNVLAVFNMESNYSWRPELQEPAMNKALTKFLDSRKAK